MLDMGDELHTDELAQSFKNEVSTVSGFEHSNIPNEVSLVESAEKTSLSKAKVLKSYISKRNVSPKFERILYQTYKGRFGFGREWIR